MTSEIRTGTQESGRLPLALRERREDIARAMRGLCDAIGAMAMVRDAVEASLKKPTGPVTETEALMLSLDRACLHLTEAAADVPNELWSVMLQQNNVGAEEVRARLTAACNAAA